MTTRIPKQEAPSLDSSPVTFSFKHLDLGSNSKFHLQECDVAFLHSLLENLKQMSSWTVAELCDYENGKHSHHIHFDQTTEPDGFPALLDHQLEPEYFWQFSLDPKTFWRVHGFILDSTFFIVWLDPQHKLYRKPQTTADN